MADKKDMSDISKDLEDAPPAESQERAEGIDVLTNAVRRLDNRFRGKPNDSSLIGEDMPDEEEEDDGDGEAEDKDEKEDDWPEPKGTKLW